MTSPINLIPTQSYLLFSECFVEFFHRIAFDPREGAAVSHFVDSFPLIPSDEKVEARLNLMTH